MPKEHSQDNSVHLNFHKLMSQKWNAPLDASQTGRLCNKFLCCSFYSNSVRILSFDKGQDFDAIYFSPKVCQFIRSRKIVNLNKILVVRGYLSRYFSVMFWQNIMTKIYNVLYTFLSVDYQNCRGMR